MTSVRSPCQQRTRWCLDQTRLMWIPWQSTFCATWLCRAGIHNWLSPAYIAGDWSQQEGVNPTSIFSGIKTSFWHPAIIVYLSLWSRSDSWVQKWYRCSITDATKRQLLLEDVLCWSIKLASIAFPPRSAAVILSKSGAIRGVYSDRIKRKWAW